MCLQASLAVTVDPVDRAMRVRAGVVFPGPEWRDDVYNEDTRRIELVKVRNSSTILWNGSVVVASRRFARARSGCCSCCAARAMRRTFLQQAALAIW